MRVAIAASISEALTEWLMSHPEGHERGGILFLRKFTDRTGFEEVSDRYVLIDWRPLTADEVLESSPVKLRYHTRNLPKEFFRAEQERLIFGFVHSHPSGGLAFSDQDADNERTLLRALTNYSSSGYAEVFALLKANGGWLARVRKSTEPADPIPSRHILVHGHRTRAHAVETNELVGWNSRQAAAFGKPFNNLLSKLRVACVGLGGTGTPLVHTAARSGIGELVIIDGDDVEGTNLNRTIGYAVEDIGFKKAIVSKKSLTSIGLENEVVAFDQFLHKCPPAIESLATCDFIFGCTDDVIGRDILNQAAFYYCLPYIDVGLTGRVAEAEGENPSLVEHRARVSTILPESGACLRCQRVVTEEKLRFQQELGRRPELADLDAETLKREFYLTGGERPLLELVLSHPRRHSLLS